MKLGGEKSTYVGLVRSRLAKILRSRPKLSYIRRLSLTGFLFVLPVLVFFAVFSVYPMFNAFYLSFTNYDLVSRQDFIGFENYKTLIEETDFKQALGVTGRFTMLYSVPTTVIALLIALLLRGQFRGRNFFRWLFLVPPLLSMVGMSTIWRVMLNRDGPINALLDLRISWMSDRTFALVGIVFMDLWRTVGWYILIFLVGLEGIPKEYYDAAKVDGASSWQILRSITLPLLRPTIALVVIFIVVHSVKIFAPMFIMTEGGPFDTTNSAVMQVYRDGIRNLKMGLANAEAVILFILILIFTIIQLRLFGVGREDQ